LNFKETLVQNVQRNKSPFLDLKFWDKISQLSHMPRSFIPKASDVRKTRLHSVGARDGKNKTEETRALVSTDLFHPLCFLCCSQIAAKTTTAASAFAPSYRNELGERSPRAFPQACIARGEFGRMRRRALVRASRRDPAIQRDPTLSERLSSDGQVTRRCSAEFPVDSFPVARHLFARANLRSAAFEARVSQQ